MLQSFSQRTSNNLSLDCLILAAFRRSRNLAEPPGLNLIVFDAHSIAVIILIVMGIAFLPGTLPAARGATAEPVEFLRCE
ncbi:hypothetical protein IWX64_001197 [Arthrobacter sp. CAN_A212]|uniref:hypothetical protein n=1 Tax=Arthrobacter sp. CAN_A212 TaxID=2787719 RepID=UPI001A242464